MFFLATDVVDDREVIAQVGWKADGKPVPVCLCFAHTLAEIQGDVAVHDGARAIMTRSAACKTMRRGEYVDLTRNRPPLDEAGGCEKGQVGQPRIPHAAGSVASRGNEGSSSLICSPSYTPLPL